MSIVGLVAVLIILVVGYTYVKSAGTNFENKLCGSVLGTFICPNKGMAGHPCNAPDGTIWPFSGCDVSAGICCNGKCGSGCNSSGSGGSGGSSGSSGMSGQPCSAADGTIWPFSGCDVSAGICCHKKCGTGC